MEMVAYKLVRKKGDKYYPLFITKNEETEIGKWMPAECHPTKGFAIRQGWHCCFKPYAPHLKEELASGEKRVWVKCKIRNFEKYNRPESQGGAWLLAQELMVVRELTKSEVQKLRC